MAPTRHPRSTPSHSRGFTLIELMVVVVIITILSTLAVPSMLRRMRDKRVQMAAQQIAALYRNARMRAMGRGSAVLVRYTTATGYEIREAIQGATANPATCAMRPVSSCLFNDWNLASQYRKLDTFVPAQYDLSQTIDTTLRQGGGAVMADPVELCFTPSGRAYMRSGGAGFQAMNTVVTVDVQRKDAGTGVGLMRTVNVLPNGTSRLAL